MPPTDRGEEPFLIVGDEPTKADDDGGGESVEIGGSDETPAQVGAWRVRDGEGTRLEVVATAGFEPEACLPDGAGVLSNARGEANALPVLELASTTSLDRSASIPVPEGAAGPYTQIRNYGSEVLLWSATVAGGGGPPQPTSTAWRLTEALTWARLGGGSGVPVPSAGRGTAVIGDSVLSVVPGDSTSGSTTVQAIV